MEVRTLVPSTDTAVPDGGQRRQSRPPRWAEPLARRRRARLEAEIAAHYLPSLRDQVFPATVVVITQNRRDELLANLARLTALPERPRLIVVDNGCGEGSGEAVRQRYPQVEVLVLAANVGAAARNVAVELVDDPYVAFADDDTWWEPGSLSAAVPILDRHPQIATVTARILMEPSGREDPIVTDMRDSALADDTSLPGRPLVSFLAGASVVRRSAFRQVGGFEPRLGLGGEEELMSMELMAAGWHLRYIPELTVHHAASSRRDPHRRRADGFRNTLWTTWLRRPAPRAIRRTAALLRSSPLDRVTRRAVVEALAGLPWVIRERQVVPAGVERRLRVIEDDQLRSPARRYIS